MTKKEIAAFTQRIAAKIERGHISARPLSAAAKKRAEQIIARSREEASEVPVA